MSKRSHYLFSIIAVFLGFGSECFAEKGANPSDIPIKAFAQLKYTSSMQISPDGSHLAYFVPYNGRQAIIIHPIADSKNPAVIPAANNAEIAWFRWANENRIVVSYAFTSTRGILTTRETRLYGFDRDGQNMTNLIKARKKQKVGTRLGKEDVSSQFQDDVIDWLPDDPENILVVVDADVNGKAEVRQIDVGTGNFKELTSGRLGIQNYRTDQQHEIRLAWGFDESKFYNSYKSPMTNGWKSIEKTSWGDKGFDLLDFFEDPKIGYARGLNEYGRKAIYKINLETNEILEPVFSHEKVDVDGIVDHPITRKPAGIQYTVDQPEIIYFSNELKSIQKTIDMALPDTVNRITSMQPDKRLYLVYAQSDVEPGVYYLLDMIGKKLQFISETMPGIKPGDMSPVKAVSYKSRDGVDIPAYLTIPKGKEAKGLPTVILVHGGPHSRYTKMFHYTVQFLASRGYAVLQPNFRGSEGFGDAYEDAGRHQWGGIMQDDVVDGTKWLIGEGIANPEKICIVGSSYGGYAAAMGLIQTPELFKCGISISAVLNIPSLITFDKKFIGGKSWTKTMGLEGADPETVSPYHLADKITDPLLIIHAKDDHRVRYRQAESMHKKMKKLKKDVTFVTLEDGDHNLDTESSRTKELSAMEKFLKKHIGK